MFRENPAVTRGKAIHDLSNAVSLSAEGMHPSRGVKGIVQRKLHCGGGIIDGS